MSQADQPNQPNQHDQLALLALAEITPNPEQPRKLFPERAMRELVESIRMSGLVQPIVVRPVGDSGYQLVAGERRYRAFCQLASEDAAFGRIPAVVRSIEDAELPIVSLVENIVRDDLNPIERAEALHALRTHLNATWDVVAERVGLSVRAVHFLTGTLKLRQEFKDALAKGEITEKHGRALQRLGAHPTAAYDLFEYIRSQSTTKRPTTGDDAIAIAAVLRKYPSMSAEEAHRYLTAGTIDKPKPPSARSPVTPADHVSRGLRLAMRYRTEIQSKKLDDEQRRALIDTAKAALVALESLVVELD